MSSLAGVSFAAKVSGGFQLAETCELRGAVRFLLSACVAIQVTDQECG